MQFKARLLAAVAVAVAGGGSLAAAGTGAVAHSPRAHPWLAGGRIAAPSPAGRNSVPVTGATKSYAYNWSGYAQVVTKKGTYKAAKDHWKVPTVNTTLAGSQYSADWVGIGGYSDATLVQCGTEADNIHGKAVYRAWTEIIPASEVVISGLAIHPGDSIEGLVKETSPGTWRMTVDDLTTGKSGGRTVSYSSSGLSAEAVHERPQVGGSLAKLAHTTKVTFDPGSYSTAAPGTLSWKPLLATASGATLHQIFMVNNGGTAIIAAPSAADSDSDGFAVAYGKTSPASPAS